MNLRFHAPIYHSVHGRSAIQGEVNVMQQRLKETEREVTDERFIKNKTNVENADLQRTNLQLNQQIDELRLQLRRVGTSVLINWRVRVQY